MHEWTQTSINSSCKNMVYWLFHTGEFHTVKVSEVTVFILFEHFFKRISFHSSEQIEIYPHHSGFFPLSFLFFLFLLKLAYPQPSLHFVVFSLWVMHSVYCACAKIDRLSNHRMHTQGSGWHLLRFYSVLIFVHTQYASHRYRRHRSGWPAFILWKALACSTGSLGSK